MDIRKLQRTIVDGLEAVKAHDIVVFNTEHLSALFERVIIASGTSNRQTKALAAGVRETVRSRGFTVFRTEGEENGEWIIVDCGAAVVHVMQPSIREYYHLEEIWGDKPVRLKLDTAVARLVKAEEPAAPVPTSRGRAAAGSGSTPAAPERKRAAARPARTLPPSADAALAGAAPRKPATKAVGAKRTTAGKSTRSPARGGAAEQSTRAEPRATLAPVTRAAGGKSARSAAGARSAESAGSAAPPTRAPRRAAGAGDAPAKRAAKSAPAKTPSRPAATRTVGVKRSAGSAAPVKAARKSPSPARSAGATAKKVGRKA